MPGRPARPEPQATAPVIIIDGPPPRAALVPTPTATNDPYGGGSSSLSNTNDSGDVDVDVIPPQVAPVYRLVADNLPKLPPSLKEPARGMCSDDLRRSLPWRLRPSAPRARLLRR